MAGPNSFSLESIRDFILFKGGKVTNHELVKHFKDALTQPDRRDEARNLFKEHVNTLATITRNEEGEKYLILKKKYRGNGAVGEVCSPTPSMSSLGNQTFYDTLESSLILSPPTQQVPPSYRPPPPPSETSSEDSVFYEANDGSSPRTPPEDVSPPPPVPPRRKSSEKLRENKENEEMPRRPRPICEDPDIAEGLVENSKISVKECMQKFNKLAATDGGPLFSKSTSSVNKKREKGDDDDTGSVATLDQKAREWLVRCAQANYQAIAKLASENPKLVKLKDPTNGYTALHWGAKHGNENVIKLIAGTHGADVNIRTNGGYTALHIAMQFGHEEIYNLLIQVYGADTNLRDWSGKKARQYLANKDTSVSADTFRKIKARKKQAAEKDLGFLRIGSLNVRVKRTTEAFSNFLGVGSADKLHKHWGSADNIPQSDSKKMPPPKFAPIKKRKSKRGADFATNRSNTTELCTVPADTVHTTQDSDSDTAAGFGSNWQSTV